MYQNLPSLQITILEAFEYTNISQYWDNQEYCYLTDDVVTIVMDFSMELPMSYYSGHREPKTMPPEWLVVPESRIKLHSF